MRVLKVLMGACAALFVLSGCATFFGGGEEATQEPTPRAKAFNHYLMGVIHQKNGRFEDAIGEFRQASDHSPDSLPLTKQLVRAYILVHDFENARVMCERGVVQDPNDPVLWFALGRVNRQLERYEEATQAFRQAIMLNPESALSYEELIRAEEESNDLIASIDLYEKLIELHPDSAVLYFRLGLNLARIHKTREAVGNFEKALELNPELGEARNVLGVLYLELEENGKAAEALGRYVGDAPDDANARANLAVAMTRLGRIQEAAQMLAELCNSEQAMPEHFVELVFVLLHEGLYEDAARVIPPNDAPIFGTLLRGWARKALGEPYRPLLDTLDAIEGDVDAECGEYLGEVLFLFGEEESGRFLLSMLTGLRDEGVMSKRLDTILGRTLIGLGRPEEAEVVLHEALGRYGEDKWVHFYLAGLYEEAGKVELAEGHLKACLELDPDDPEVMNFLGYLYADKNYNLADAERLLRRALEMEPENGFYLDSLGWVFYRQGKADEAVEYIRRAILRMNTDDAVLRDHLGDAYLLKGDVDKALAEWDRALRLDPEIKGVREKIEKRKGESLRESR